MGPGGSFKKLNDSFLTEECAHEISSYFSLEVCTAPAGLLDRILHAPMRHHTLLPMLQEGQYWVDVARVAEDARQHFEGLSEKEPPKPSKVIVFDIDETTLSNAAEWQLKLQVWIGLHQRKRTVGRKAALPATAPDATQAPNFEKTAVGITDRPPLAPMLGLYHYFYASGFRYGCVHMCRWSPQTACSCAGIKCLSRCSHPSSRCDFGPPSPLSVAFVTGRNEAARNSTAINLKAAGYGSLCKSSAASAGSSHAEEGGTAAEGGQQPDAFGRPGTPCYVALHLRDMGDDRLASVYKPDRRAALEAAGFDIYGNFGDQFSDLDGTSSAPHSFKLPNPAYLIL